MRKKVLFVTCEMLPFPGKPVCGGGIRVWGLGQGIAAAGHEVIYSLPAELVSPDDSLPDSILTNAHEPEKLNELIIQIMPDLVIIEQWGLATYIENLKIPLAIDLHGPLSLENAFKTGGNFLSDALTKINALAKADFLICPGQLQKRYFYTWFLMAGVDPLEAKIAVVPVGMPPDMPQKQTPEHPSLVYGGVTWPWIDPFPGLKIAGRAVSKKKDASFELFIQSPPLLNNHPLYSINKNILQSYDDKLSGLDGVEIKPFIPHDELIDHYTKATAAFDLYRRNQERELAVTTRTVEYMWAGLPVIYANYAELARPIEQYDAGWIVDPDDEKAINKAVDEVLNDPQLAQSKGRNAQKLVKENYTWKASVKELLPLIENSFSRKRSGTLISGIRDYFRTESVEEILEGKNKVADLNDEIRGVMVEAEKEKRDRDRRIEVLGEQVREVTFEKDKQIRQMLADHKKELDKKDDEIKRLLEKLDYETQTRDKEIQRLHTDRQLSESKLQDEVAQLNREKENDRREAQTELTRVTERLQEESARISESKDEEKEKYLTEIKSLHVERTKDAKQNSEQIKKLNDEKEELRKSAATELKNAIEEKDKAAKEAKTKNEAKVDKLQEQIDELTEKHEQSKKEFGDEISSLNREKEQTRKEHEAEVRDLIKKHDAYVAELRMEQDKKIVILETKFESEIERSKKKEEDLQAEIRLLNREQQELVIRNDHSLAKANDKYEQKLAGLTEQNAQRIKEAEEKLTAESERRKNLEIDLQTEIRQLNRERQEMIQKHDSALFHSNERYEERLSKLNQEYEKRLNELKDKQDNEAESHFEFEKELQAEIGKLNRERQDMVIRHDQALSQANSRYEEKLATLQNSFDKKAQEYESKLVAEREKRKSSENDLQSEIKQLNRERESLISNRDETISKANEKYEQKLSKLNEDHEKQLKELQAKLEKEIDKKTSAENELQTEIRKLNRDQQKFIAERDIAISQANEKYEQKLSKQSEQHEKQINELQSKLEKESEKRTSSENELQTEIRKLNRDQQKFIAERDIAISQANEKYEQKLSKQSEQHEKQIKELQGKLEKEVEKRSSTEKELQAEIRTLNRERQEIVSRHDQLISGMTEKHQKELSGIKTGSDEDIKEISRKTSRELEKLEDALKQAQDDLRRISLQKEDELRKLNSRFEKMGEEHRAEFKEAAINASTEIQRREKQIEKHAQDITKIENIWKGKLDGKDADIQTLRNQLDQLNAQITSRLTELDRVASEKEIFVREAQKRFEMIETKASDQHGQINGLTDQLNTANATLKKADMSVRTLTSNLERAKDDFQKLSRHADNLESEIPSLRRRTELAEREVEGFLSKAELKSTSKRQKQKNKYLMQLPKLGLLWGVNLATNSYMELWQKRTGVKLFPGTEKDKNKKNGGDA